MRSKPLRKPDATFTHIDFAKQDCANIEYWEKDSLRFDVINCWYAKEYRYKDALEVIRSQASIIMKPPYHANDLFVALKEIALLCDTVSLNFEDDQHE